MRCRSLWREKTGSKRFRPGSGRARRRLVCDVPDRGKAFGTCAAIFLFLIFGEKSENQDFVRGVASSRVGAQIQVCNRVRPFALTPARQPPR